MNRSLLRMAGVAALTGLLTGGGAAAPAPPGPAASAEASQARLAALRARIATVSSRLATELSARDALRARLRSAELDIAAKRRRLDQLRAAQLAAARRGAELRAGEARTRTALEAARTALGGQLRAAYMIGRQEPVKLLLNQLDPSAAGRMLVYYGYFARQRAAGIAALDAGVRQMADLAAEAARQSAALAALQADARRELDGLMQARAERTAALTALAGDLSSGSRELAELQREAQAVEALLADLTRVLQDFPVDTQQPFEQLRGRLPWPVVGRLAPPQPGASGGPSDGALRGSGVSIETARGAKVRAPYFGRVVYADWLPGLGLLIILGHSDGYLTLYGHAEVLYKSVGDWVAPGDVIAGLNDGDGAPPRLYFEIRRGRKPLDPKAWMKMRP